MPVIQCCDGNIVNVILNDDSSWSELSNFCRREIAGHAADLLPPNTLHGQPGLSDGSQRRCNPKIALAIAQGVSQNARFVARHVLPLSPKLRFGDGGSGR